MDCYFKLICSSNIIPSEKEGLQGLFQEEEMHHYYGTT